MTPEQFRRIALSLPGALESSHMGHPDFRVGKRIFATLGYPDAGSGMVKLSPQEQELFMRVAPDEFAPAKGAWGRQGSTTVRLRGVKATLMRDALTAAWRNVAPAPRAGDGDAGK